MQQTHKNLCCYSLLAQEIVCVMTKSKIYVYIVSLYDRAIYCFARHAVGGNQSPQQAPEDCLIKTIEMLVFSYIGFRSTRKVLKVRMIDPLPLRLVWRTQRCLECEHVSSETVKKHIHTASVYKRISLPALI